MKRTRPMTAEEKERLRRLIDSMDGRLRPGQRLLIAICVSLFIFTAFVFGSVLGEKRSWREACRRGMPTLLFGPAFLLLLRSNRGKGDPIGTARSEISAGLCRIREYRISEAWPLAAYGGTDATDLLVKTARGQFIALPGPLPNQGQPLDLLEIGELPSSRFIVSADFSGEPVTLHSTGIRADNEWRNDDLPFHRPIGLQRLPPKVQAAVSAS